MSHPRFDARRPSDAGELLDDAALPDADMRRALDDIALSNRRLGAHRAIIAAVGDLIRVAAREGRGPVTLLDVGCGAGDVALVLASWARERRLPLRIIALDASPIACSAAARAMAAEPSVEVLQGDAMRLPFADGAVDVIHVGMLLHHVLRPEQASFLRRLASLARVGLVVSDLRRSRSTFVAVAAYACLTRCGRVFRHDAPLSVARGFTSAEARQLANATALRGLRVDCPAPGRTTWTLGPLPRR